MNKYVRDIIIGIGSGAAIYLIIKKTCKQSSTPSSTGASGASNLDNSGGASSGSLFQGNSGMEAPFVPAQTNPYQSNPLVNNTTTPPITNTPVIPSYMISQPTPQLNNTLILKDVAQQIASENNPVQACFSPYVLQNGKCILPAGYNVPTAGGMPLSLPPSQTPINFNIPVAKKCAPGYALMENGSCAPMIMISQINKNLNTKNAKYMNNPTGLKPVNRYASGGSRETMTDEQWNKFIGFGRKN
ncbi:MAG: hypothetical protein ACRDE2_00070 [Chitinophagaceae bacterium]